MALNSYGTEVFVTLKWSWPASSYGPQVVMALRWAVTLWHLHNIVAVVIVTVLK